MINIFHEERSITVFRKTPIHIPNMAMINAVSKLTWRAFERHYSLTTYERLVGKLQQTIPVYPVSVSYTHLDVYKRQVASHNVKIV